MMHGQKNIKKTRICCNCSSSNT